MQITRMSVSNWRNFKQLDVALDRRLFVVGPNASGKSNFLDLFQFLADLAGPGGGLSPALARRGGFKRVQSLFARNHKRGAIVLDITLQDGEDRWHYVLEIKTERDGLHRPLVHKELVEHNDTVLLDRPTPEDEADRDRLTQTHLEQIAANTSFRIVADHFAKTRYFHLVPQVIRDPSRSGGSPNDPFGGDFIAQINSVKPERVRKAYVRRIEQALQSAVPQFESLTIDTDDAGRPHLIAGYRNWRSAPSNQTEREFSDGTLRLIGMLWTIVSSPAQGGVLLLEEPELSLDSGIVRTLPTVFAAALRERPQQQLILSTHAPQLLDDEGVLPREVLVLRVGGDGTTADLLSDIAECAPLVEADLPASEIIGSLIEPDDLRGLLGAVAVPR